MTAEVVVLNKSAVALAADSAVTVVVDGVQKSYQADKLFALKESEPVGVMFYGNAEFMGMPWEALVHMYRQESGAGRQSSIRRYAVDFLQFIKEATGHNADAELDNARRIAIDAVNASRLHVEDAILEVLTRRYPQARLGSRERNALLRKCLEARVGLLGRIPPFRTADAKKLSTTLAACWDRVTPQIDRVFSEFRVTNAIHRLLKSIITLSLERQVMTTSYSGLVVAGFGTKDLFPTAISGRVDGCVAGALRVQEITRQNIGRRNRAVVGAFAQREMVERFMNGVDPDVLKYLLSLEDLVYNFGKAVLKARGALTGHQDKALRSAAKKEVGEYREGMHKFLHEYFSNPVVEAVAHLPREDLATMAESLVSLTSLKRHVSSELETVGGPVDVAVLSKGAGFVWVKRKALGHEARHDGRYNPL